MPAWAQIFFCIFPIAIFVLACGAWVVRRISHLEGKVDAILALFAALVGVAGKNSEDSAKGGHFRNTGLPGG